MPIDERQLARMNAKAGRSAQTITVERSCQACGYNLLGLPLGGRCPECGLPTASTRAIDDPLSLMPVPVIKAFGRGCWVASVCVLGVIGLLVCGTLTAISSVITTASLLGIAVVWVVATWLLTPAFDLRQAVTRGFSRESRLRPAARWLQIGWAVAAGAALAGTLVATPPAAVDTLIRVGIASGLGLGLAGVVVLSILMERLSEWVRNDVAERAFNLAMWGLPVLTPVLLAMLGIPFNGMTFLVIVLWLVTACAFPYALLSLSRSVTLSILHAREQHERDRRRHDRSERYHEHAARAVAAMDEARGQAGHD